MGVSTIRRAWAEWVWGRSPRCAPVPLAATATVVTCSLGLRNREVRLVDAPWAERPVTNDRVAQAALGVPGAGVPDALVRGAGRPHRPIAGAADGGGVPVGDRAATPRVRLGGGFGASAPEPV